MQSDCEHQLCQEINDKCYSISQKYCNANFGTFKDEASLKTSKFTLRMNNQSEGPRLWAFSSHAKDHSQLLSLIRVQHVLICILFLFFLVTFQQPSVLRITLYVSVPDPIKYPPAHPSHKQVLKRPGYLWHKSSNGRHRPWGPTLKTDTASYRATEA